MFILSVPIVNAAGTAGEYAIPAPCRLKIVDAYITDTDGIAADNTDYVDSDITGTTGYDSRAANQGAITADTPVQLTLSASGVIVEKGGQLKVTVAKGGSGKAMEAAVAWLVQIIN
jgi:hypothetical protein